MTESASSERRGKIDADGGATVRTGLETQTHEYHQTSELTGTGTKSVLTDVGGKDSSLFKEQHVQREVFGVRDTLHIIDDGTAVAMGANGEPQATSRHKDTWTTVWTPYDGSPPTSQTSYEDPGPWTGERDWFATASDFAAGLGDGFSCGLTQLVRQALGFDDVVNKGSAWYIGGQVAGTLGSVAFGGVSACQRAAWAAKSIRGIGAVQGLGSAAGAAQAAANGDPLGAALGVLGARAGFAKFREACFVAGTPVVLADGTTKRVEDIRGYDVAGDGCDAVLTRDENDHTASPVARRVVRTFVRNSPVLELVVKGVRVGTTAEHPFWVVGAGWRPASELKAGDRLLRSDGGCVTVDEVEESGRVETVYNFEVEEHHTYFVGNDEWGFDVWAHNAYFTRLPPGQKASIINRGGRFADLDAARLADEVGHHMPQNAYIRTLGVSRSDGPAIGMTIADHAWTRTFSGRGAATMRTDAPLTARQRFELDVDDIRSEFGNAYDNAIAEALEYANTLPWFV